MNKYQKEVMLARIKMWAVLRLGELPEDEDENDDASLQMSLQMSLVAIVTTSVINRLSGFTEGSPMHRQVGKHLPWLVEQGYLTPADEGRVWFFHEFQIKRELGL